MKYSHARNIGEFVIAILPLVLFFSFDAVYADNSIDDIDQVILYKPSGSVGGSITIKYLKINKRNSVEDGKFPPSSGSEAVSLEISSKLNIKERLAWAKNGRRTPEPSKFIFKLARSTKGSLSTQPKTEIFDLLSRILSGKNSKTNTRRTSAQRGALIYITRRERGDDFNRKKHKDGPREDKNGNHFELASSIKYFPLTPQETKRLGITDYILTPTEEALLQFDESISQLTTEQFKDTPTKLVLSIIDQLSLSDTPPNIFVEEAGHQFRVGVKIKVTGTLSKNQQKLLNDIQDAFRGSTRKHKRVEISFDGVGEVKKEIKKDDLTDFELGLVDSLVADIAAKKTVVEIKIDAKFGNIHGNPELDHEKEDLEEKDD